MIRKSVFLLSALAMVGACSSEKKAEEPKAEAAGVPTLHEMMTQRIDVDADAIWAIGNAALNDEATIDPAKMNPQSWAALQAAAERMAGHAKELQALDPIVVTRAGVRIADEGTPGAPTPAQIQAHLQKDTDVYRALADSLTQHGVDLAAAAKAQDAATAGRLINEMDGVCEACHLEFWYPEQKALVESILAKDAAAEKNATR